MIVPNATSVLIFQYKNAKKMSLKKFYNFSISITTKQIYEGNRWYVLLENQNSVNNIISRAEKEGAITACDSPQSSTRGLSLQVEKDLGLRVSHETIRNVIEKHKYSSRVYM